MSDYILEMNHIVKEFSGVKSLNYVNLNVYRGVFVGILFVLVGFF